MKSNYFSSAIIFIFTLLISLSVNAETEPNNDIENANEVALNSTQQGSLNMNFNGDRYDFYKIIVPIDGRLTLLPSNTTENRYKLLIHSIDKDNNAYSMFHWEGNSGNILAVNISPGIYFIEINNSQNSWVGNYSVQFKFDVLTHIDKEPNDIKENASTLILNQENGGNLINRKNGDWDSHDFWKITIIEDGRLTINDNTESTLDYQIFIRDEDGKHFRWEMRKKDNSGDRIACSLTPGTYFLDISRTSGGYQNYGCYTIFPEFTPTEHPGDTEPNDTKENASTLVLNKLNSGNLIFRKNGDWDSHDFWKILITQEGRLTINDNTESTLNYKILFYAEDMSLIRWENRPKDNLGDRMAYNLSPGIYYIEIRKDAGSYTTYGSYTIEPGFVLTKYKDISEPNDKLEEAKELMFDVENKGSLGSRKLNTWDYVDYWKFSLTKETSIIFDDNTESTLSYKILLQRSDGSTFAWESRAKDNIGDRIEKLLSPGDYIIKIDNQHTGNSTYGSYSIFPEIKARLGLPDLSSEFSVYPNPVQEILHIDSQINGDSFIEIIDVNGKTVVTKLMKTISGEINLSSLSRGVYYVRITNDEYSISKKIIVE